MIDPTNSATIIEAVKIISVAAAVIIPSAITGVVALRIGRRQALETSRLRAKELIFGFYQRSYETKELEVKEWRKAFDSLDVVVTNPEATDAELRSTGALEKISASVESARLSLLEAIPAEIELDRGLLYDRWSADHVRRYKRIRQELADPINCTGSAGWKAASRLLGSKSEQLLVLYNDILMHKGMVLFKEYDVIPRTRIWTVIADLVVTWLKRPKAVQSVAPPHPPAPSQ